MTYAWGDEWGVDELERAKADLQAKMLQQDELIAELKSQIGQAKADRLLGGGYADPDWWRRVNDKVKHCGRTRQAMQLELAELNRHVRAARHRRDASDDFQRLRRAVQDCTSPSQFDLIWRAFLASKAGEYPPGYEPKAA